MRALRRTRRKASSRRVSSSSASRVQYLTRLRFEPLEGRTLLSLAPVLVDLQAASDSGVYSDDNLTNVAAPTIDITAAEAGQAIRVYREGVLVGEAAQIDGTLYRYGFLSGQLAEGSNTITARSFDGVEESEDSPGLVITLDTAGPRVVGHSPEGVVSPVDFLTVTFNEPIAPATLTAADVSVFGSSLPALVGSYDTSGYARGVVVSGTLAYVADYSSGLQILRVMPEVVSIAQTDQTTWQINLSSALAQGTCQVSIGPHVTDLSGNAMDQDADGTGGETSDDVYTFSFTVDATPPIPGDANRGGTVYADDARILAAHWGRSGMSWAEGDFNEDGVVNAADAAILAANWGQGVAEAGGPQTPLVGPVQVSQGGVVRRRIEPVERMDVVEADLLSRPVSESTADEAGGAADAALGEEFGPVLEPAGLDRVAIGRLAWSHTVGRRRRG